MIEMFLKLWQKIYQKFICSKKTFFDPALSESAQDYQQIRYQTIFLNPDGPDLLENIEDYQEAIRVLQEVREGKQEVFSSEKIKANIKELI
jgi:hypothetical protein